MRIIQLLTRPQRRGAELFALQLSERLREMGHEVMVVTLLKGAAEISFSGQLIRLDRPDSKRFDWVGFWRLKTIFESFKPDLVQANASDTLRYGVFAKLVSRKKFKLVYRNANLMSPFVKSRLSKDFYQFLINRVEGIASVAEATRLDVLEFYQYRGKIQRIPIGIECANFDLLMEENKEIDLPGNFLLFMGGLVPEKSPISLLESFVANREKWNELHLIYLGGGILETQLREKIQSLGADDVVHILPNQSNPFPILKKAKALVMPSKIEGLPAVILEAMYCRVPVIAFSVGGIGEVVQTGETGWCVEPNNPEAFVQAIDQVLHLDEGEKSKVLDQAFSLVKEQFELSRIAKQFEEFYFEILDSYNSNY
jgi:glycosyltransferase involved in cell wall biosynthesis